MTNTGIFSRRLKEAAGLWTGSLACVTITLASYCLASLFGGPAVLYCLFLGMAFHWISAIETTAPGVEFCARWVLMVGVTCLGVQVNAAQLALLSAPVIALVIGGIFLTFGVALLCNKWVRWPTTEAAICGGSVAICGASAAAALSLTAPPGKIREESLIAVIVAVATWSTLAMVTYPFIITWCGLSGSAAGIVIGGSIHDVSQVVGAGAMLDSKALETGTMIKMLRVACLVPAMVVFAFFASRGVKASDGKSPSWIKAVPIFLWGFVILAAFNVAGLIPDNVGKVLARVSSICIVLAIAGIGIKTNLKKLRQVGWKPLVIMSIASIVLFAWCLGGVLVLAHFGWLS